MKYILAILLGSWVTLIAVLVLLRARVIRDWLSRHRADLHYLSESTPVSARPWMVTGWALAGGIGFGILLPNITELFGTAEQAVTLGTAAVFLIPCTTLTVYFLYLHRRTIVLQHLWGILAWVHYRPVLSVLSSYSRGRLDFVTHRGSDFSDKLRRAGGEELAFRLADDSKAPRPGPTPDLIIADLDILDSIAKVIGKTSADTKLLPLREWQLDGNVDRVFEELPGRQDASSAEYLPIRWGFNAMTVYSGDPKVRQSLVDEATDLPKSIDIRALLDKPEETPLGALWSNGTAPTILLLDWYLPNMAALVQSFAGRSAWSEADDGDVNVVRECLAKLTELLAQSASANNLSVSDLFCPDAVTLQERTIQSETSIVLVGGNFLWCERSSTLTPERVVHLPFIIEGQPRCLWWQECLVVPFDGPLRGELSEWRGELTKIVKHLNVQLSALNGLMPFHGYLPGERRAGFEGRPELASSASRWRQFALENATPRQTHARADAVWSDLWADWRAEID